MRIKNTQTKKEYSYIKLLITFPDMEIDGLVLDKFKKLAKKKGVSVSSYIRSLIYNEVVNEGEINKDDLYNLKQKEIDLLLKLKKEN